MEKQEQKKEQFNSFNLNMKFVDVDKLRDELQAALCIGPMNKLNDRLNMVFDKHFGQPFQK